jgi:hypothetical protein
MSESGQVPQQESRGGDAVDWAKVVPGEPLPPLRKAAYPEPDSEALPGGDVTVTAGLAAGTGGTGPQEEAQS